REPPETVLMGQDRRTLVLGRLPDNRRKLVDRRAPAIVETHFLMLAAVLGRLVQDARRIKCAAILRFEGQDRSDGEPGFGGLPAFGQDGGKDEPPFGNRFQKTAIYMWLERRVA